MEKTVVPIVQVPTKRITNWATFHDVFNEILDFPPYYGRNMNAWIDCLTYVDDPDARMPTITVDTGDVLTLQLDAINDFPNRCPEQYAALIECAAFVNWRRIEVGERLIITLAFHKT